MGSLTSRFSVSKPEVVVGVSELCRQSGASGHTFARGPASELTKPAVNPAICLCFFSLSVHAIHGKSPAEWLCIFWSVWKTNLFCSFHKTFVFLKKFLKIIIYLRYSAIDVKGREKEGEKQRF